jgi:hypothetical protein
MTIVGFTIIKNAVKFDYPFTESIRSILPLVDKFIVLIGDGDDNTEAVVRAIGSEKIEIHHSVWDAQVKEGGSVLAIETNKAFDLVPPDADWAFYLQADEVIHEQYLNTIRAAALKYKDDKRVEGLLFKYLHFYGTYNYVGDTRRWYNREIRLIRNDKSIRSYRDAQGFRKNGEKLSVKLIDAYVYHYGWVRHPHEQKKKLESFYTLWNGTGYKAPEVKEEDLFDYFKDVDSVEPFKGTHPAVMHERIAHKNWELNFDPSRKNFSLKDKILYWIEKKTGKRLFAYRNYKRS